MMDPDTRQNTGSRTALQLAVGLVSAVAALLLLTLLALNAFDVFAVVLLCGLVVLLERTVGDWFADQLGDAAFKVFLVAFVGALGWVALGTDMGRAAVRALLGAAYERGFESAVVSVEVPVSMEVLPSSPSTSAPAAAARPLTAHQPSTGGMSGGTNPVSPNLGNRTPNGGTAVGSGSGVPTGPLVPADTRMTVRAFPTGKARQVVLHAEVTTGPDKVTDGVVEFSLNGNVVARVSLGSDGRAVATMANLRPGSYRVTARYAGTADFREATSETIYTV